MDDLVRWLGKQLDEDKRIAKDAAFKAAAELATADRKEDHFKPPYDGSSWGRDYDHIFVVERRPDRRQRAQIADCGSGAFMLTPHIAEWDPARVLCEIDAKRQIVRWHYRRPGPKWDTPEAEGFECATCDQQFPCLTLRLLALPYVDRPGYQELEWRP